MKNLIGKKVVGFSFKTTRLVNWHPALEKHIGSVGVIINVWDDCALISFKNLDTDCFWYPLSEIEKHLIE